MASNLNGFKIAKVSLATAAISVLGWMVFNGLRVMFNLDSLPPLVSIVVGMIGIYIAYRLGLKKD